MTMLAEKQYEQVGATCGCTDHDHDLVHELSRRLDGIWRYDQYIANAANKPEIQQFWETVKQQDEDNVARLKELVSNEIKRGCF